MDSAQVTDSGLVAIEDTSAGTYSPEDATKFAKAVRGWPPRRPAKAPRKEKISTATPTRSPTPSATADGRVLISIPLGDDFTYHEAEKVADDVDAVVGQVKAAVEARDTAASAEAAALGLAPDAMGVDEK